MAFQLDLGTALGLAAAGLSFISFVMKSRGNISPSPLLRFKCALALVGEGMSQQV